MRKFLTLWVILTILLTTLLFNSFIYGQLSAPTTESVYGGTIRGISVVSTGPSSSRVFISTESANSVFYANVTTTSGSEVFGSFTVMPGLGSDDGYGSGITKLYAHMASGYLFFLNNNTLYKTIYSSSTVTMIEPANISDFIIYGDYLFYIKDSNFIFSQINASGDIVVGTTDTLAIGATISSPSIQVNKSNNKIYIASVSTTPAIYKSSDAYNSLTGSSSFSALTVGSLTASMTSVDAFGIGPDGTFFYGGDDNSNKFVQYSVDEGTTWSGGATSISGVGGSNFSFAGSASPYKVVTAKCYSTYTSGSGLSAWAEFGNSSFETHPNDGVVFVDPNNEQIIYVTTDQGIGATKNGGSVLFEIDTGVEAVQVNDFSMNSGKDIAWLASKAGIRKVTSYSTSPVWTSAMFPNGDGSPYYSAEMENDNDATAYVGNLRIYKTINSGSSWSQVLSEATTGYASVGTRAEAIEVYPTNSSLVLAGFYVDGSNDGGLWYSTDSGSSWTQQLLKAVSGTSDVDVYDIEFTSEGGNPVAYIGVEYNSSTSARSVYRAEWTGAAWSTRQDFDGSYTAVGYAITASIRDINVSSDSIFVCGTDAGSNHPIVYSREYTSAYTTSAGKWTTLTTTGFPTSEIGRAVAVGGGVVHCAVGNIIYTIPQGSGTTWSTGYSYPAGTEINVLFYDDLLVGTGTGLYGHQYTGALPVELVYFKANTGHDKVELIWETATEINNYGFEVERKTEDGKWNKIQFVHGYGNSNSPKVYKYIDQPIGGKTFWYRLKQIDFDGAFEYSDEVSVSIEMESAFKVIQNFPNPFNPVTKIEYHLNSTNNIILEIFNPLGQKIEEISFENQIAGKHQFTWSAKSPNGNLLPSGIYLYRVTALGKDGKKQISSKKMLFLK